MGSGKERIKREKEKEREGERGGNALLSEKLKLLHIVTELHVHITSGYQHLLNSLTKYINMIHKYKYKTNEKKLETCSYSHNYTHTHTCIVPMKD